MVNHNSHTPGRFDCRYRHCACNSTSHKYWFYWSQLSNVDDIRQDDIKLDAELHFA